MGYRKLGRTSSQRKAMLRDLATDLNRYMNVFKQQKLVRKNCVQLLKK